MFAADETSAGEFPHTYRLERRRRQDGESILSSGIGIVKPIVTSSDGRRHWVCVPAERGRRQSDLPQYRYADSTVFTVIHDAPCGMLSLANLITPVLITKN